MSAAPLSERRRAAELPLSPTARAHYDAADTPRDDALMPPPDAPSNITSIINI